MENMFFLYNMVNKDVRNYFLTILQIINTNFDKKLKKWEKLEV